VREPMHVGRADDDKWRSCGAGQRLYLRDLRCRSMSSATGPWHRRAGNRSAYSAQENEMKIDASRINRTSASASGSTAKTIIGRLTWRPSYSLLIRFARGAISRGGVAEGFGDARSGVAGLGWGQCDI
jgi:hypothetical protein